ncbi:MAG: 3-dehydroquinate synthase [Bacillota bacterium]|nr:3-dehydroquinate synthase [Bacillota bacterium]
METILMETTSKKYNVVVGEDVLKEISPFLNANYKQLTKILIITDETVAKHHLAKLLGYLETYKPAIFIAPSGEKAKTFDVYYKAMTVALESHLDRKSVILSFGGGAVGDLGGFVAATFMRGIPFIQIPTTILAHDSAVGGKVAINHPLGKNMIGAFHQPDAVIYDLSFLTTLPEKEIRSGFSEVIKHALIHDVSFYQWLLNNVKDLQQLKTNEMLHILKRGITIKKFFVSQDEKETGIRAYLNFGHTLGHAIESEMGYGNITHGEAVLIGMVFALHISMDLLDLPFNIDELIQWLKLLGYTIEVPERLLDKSLISKMKQDKKSIGETIRFVLLEHIGEPKIFEVSENQLLEQLKKFKF